MTDTTRQVSNRILKFADALIKSRQCPGNSEFAAAGMSDQQLYLIRREESRNFTTEQLIKPGRHFNLDMNYFMFGKGMQQWF